MFKLYCCATHSKKLYGSGIMSLYWFATENLDERGNTIIPFQETETVRIEQKGVFYNGKQNI